MKERARVAAGIVLVLASMVILFRVPPRYFVAATFVSTSCMLIAAYEAGVRVQRGKVLMAVAIGAASAFILYLIFLAGNAGIAAFHPFGLSQSSSASIYSRIASKSNPLYLQAAVLVFDSAGYEAFFRGSLQARLSGRLGPGAAPLVAAADAAIHLISMNPLWVATTFVADLAWGLTYHYSRDLKASFASHLIWDLAVFVFLPIR